jgi:protein O-mannosyl-transferase
MSQRLAIPMLLAAAVLVFAGRFGSSFVWDDALFREGLDPVLYAGLDLQTTHTRLYRPLRVLAYTLVFKASGPNELGFHVFATLVHALCTLAVYGLLRVLRLPSALLGALLFAVHPVHVESIVFITASFDQVAVLLYLGSLTALLHGQRRAASGSRVEGAAWQGSALGLGGLALLGSELAATLPMTGVVLCVLQSRREGSRLPVAALLGLHALLAAYLAVRFGVLGLGARSQAHFGGSLLAAAASTAVIFVRYLGMLFWPWPSCLIYSPTVYPGFLAPAPAAAALFLLGLAALGVRGVLRGRPAGAAPLLFLLALAPVSNVIPSTTPMAERYLYLASVGLSLAAACLPEPAPALRRRRLYVLASAAVLLVLAATSALRTGLWRDERTLFLWARQCGGSNPTVLNNLGNAELEAGEAHQAEATLRHALRIQPDYAAAWANLGRVHEALGRSSVPVLREGIERSGGSAELWTNLAGALLRDGQPGEAERAARTGLVRFARVAELWGNLGAALLAAGRSDEACAALREGLRHAPQHPELWTSLADAELRRGNRRAALEALGRALKQRRQSARPHYFLAALLEPTEPRRAAAHYRHYLRLHPGAPDTAELRRRIAELERR